MFLAFSKIMSPLQSFIEDAPIGAAMFDRDMRYIAFSPRWLQDHRIDRIPLGESHYVVFPEIPLRWKEAHRRALQGEVIREAEDRFEPADGSVVWLRWEVRPWRDDKGATAGVIIFTEDITPQKLAEEALRESLARQRVAQAAGRIGIWDWDLARNHAFISDEWCDLFGLPRGESPSYHGFLARVHPDDRLAVDMITRAALKGSGDLDFDCRIIRADDGKTRWINSKGEIVFDATGVAIRATGAIYDITERKEMERELRELSKRKSEFMATLAHELRNPLAPIKTAVNTLECLLECGPEQKKKKAAVLKIASRQIDYLLHLLNDLLDVERVTHGKIRLDRKETDLADPIAHAVELCQADFAAKEQSLSIDVPAEPLVVLGDQVRLTQVFANLLDNASRYSGRGGAVSASARREGDYAVMRVRDNGIGMPREMLASVFDMFVQQSSDGATTSGLGIGLALARNLVELHGGEIKADSEGPGRGSEFIVRLPLASSG